MDSNRLLLLWLLLFNGFESVVVVVVVTRIMICLSVEVGSDGT